MQGITFRTGVAPLRIDALIGISGVGFAAAWNDRTMYSSGPFTIPFNTFPLVKLGQEDKWHPAPEGPPAPAEPTGKRLAHWLRCPYFTREFGWIQILIGWVLAGIFAAAIAGLIRHG